MSQASLGYTDTGQIINLVTNDVRKLEEVRTCLTVNASLFCLKYFGIKWYRLYINDFRDLIRMTSLNPLS